MFVFLSVDGKTDSYVGVMIQHEKTEFLLCTLQHGCILQQPLDLNFTEGEEVTFFLNGKGLTCIDASFLSNCVTYWIIILHKSSESFFFHFASKSFSSVCQCAKQLAVNYMMFFSFGAFLTKSQT